MATVYLYSMSDDSNTVGKHKAFLQSFSCDLMAGTTVEEPILMISSDRVHDYLNTNYVYIDKFQRYYFAHFELGANHTVIVHCKVDPLESFSSYIKSLRALVTRQEFRYNDMLLDDRVITRVGTKTQKKYIGNVGRDVSYVLTVTGGSE